MVKQLKNQIDFLIFYTKAKLEAESFRHHAGYLWWILDPLMSMAVYYFLFKVILNRGGEDYIPFLFIGLITWKWFADSVSKGSNAIIASLPLIKKIRIKKFVFPLVELFHTSWKFLMIFIFILFSYAFFGYEITLNHLFIPVVLLAQFSLIVGLTFFLASIVPFIPDLKFLITYSMRLLIYPSGVIFSLENVPEKYKSLIMLNPMAGLIDSYRNIIMKGVEPNSVSILYSLITGLALTSIGLYIINRMDREYPKLS